MEREDTTPSHEQVDAPEGTTFSRYGDEVEIVRHDQPICRVPLGDLQNFVAAASEKQPNAPVNILPPVKFHPCRIFNREPTGTRKRGLKCETCGAQADQGEAIICSQ